MDNHKKRQKIKNKYIGLLYIMPWVAGFLFLQLYPFAVSLWYSFTDIALAGDYDFVGIANYIRLFTKDADFKKSLSVTINYVLYTVPGKLICALAVALILNLKLKGIKLFRTIYYLPSILGGSVAVSALWRVMFMKTGIVNNLLGKVGIAPINWLGDPTTSLFTISLIEMWQFGSSMVIFLAALKQVPTDLYDAAKVDGSGRMRTFFKITLPMISPIILFNIVMQTINALQNFTSAFVITKGGPVKSTYLMGLKLYEDAFSKFSLGYASAQSWIMFLLILIFTGIIFGTSKYWVFYSDGGD